MVVKIRFARFGPRHSPFYNIVVAQARYVFFTFDDPDCYLQKTTPLGHGM